MTEITKDMVLRAWKDEQYRQELPEEVRSQLPAAPENVAELSDAQLDQAAGGITPGGVLLTAAAAGAGGVGGWFAADAVDGEH